MMNTAIDTSRIYSDKKYPWGKPFVSGGVSQHPEPQGAFYHGFDAGHSTHHIGVSLWAPFIDHLQQAILEEMNGLLHAYFSAFHAFDGEVSNRLHNAYLFALSTFDFGEVDQHRLHQAYKEAALLTSCAVFQEDLLPDICVDHNGEFILSYKSKVGYIDIGVTGDRKISFHVRNDIDKGLSCHGDVSWDDYKIPPELLNALENFRACGEYGKVKPSKHTKP